MSAEQELRDLELLAKYVEGSTILTIETRSGPTLALAAPPREVDALPSRVAIEFLPSAAQILSPSNPNR